MIFKRISFSVLGLHNCQIRGYSLSAFTNVAIIKQVSKQADRKITFLNVLSQIFVLELTTPSVKHRALFSCFFCFCIFCSFVGWFICFRVPRKKDHWKLILVLWILHSCGFQIPSPKSSRIVHVKFQIPEVAGQVTRNSWKISRTFCLKANNFLSLWAWKIIWFWTKHKRNYSLISRVYQLISH